MQSPLHFRSSSARAKQNQEIMEGEDISRRKKRKRKKYEP